jgi:carbamoyltransferase
VTVLGLNAYAHDAGIALVEDGRPTLVVEEERLDRVRKTTAFPVEGLRYLREHRGFSLRDVDAVAFPWRGGRFMWTVGKLVLRRFPSGMNLLRRSASPNMNFHTAIRFRHAGEDLARALTDSSPVRVRYVSHHLAHAATAFFLSPFERAAILVMDAFGDECSTSVYQGAGGVLRRVATNRFFDSAGILYSMVTKYLGFRTILDEGKVMALASYGSEDLCHDFRKLVRLLPNGRYAVEERFFGYHRYGELQPVSQAFVRRFGPARLPGEPITQRHMDVARGLQRTLEDVVLHVARHLRTALDEKALCFGGGTALNCLTNQRLARESGFDAVFVPPNPNDAGVALGAALAVAHETSRRRRTPAFAASPFLGPSYDERELLEAFGAAGLHPVANAHPADFVARLLAEGSIVGWFQGCAEMGPRALGNRSILADPRDPFLPDFLNQHVKRREFFRPYAPVVLAERAHDFFDTEVPSPYMSFAVPVKIGRRGQIPAVLSRDGTARIQTVLPSENPELHRLITAFDRLTGVPLLLNTSFNAEEPTVCAPADAVRMFVDSELDALVMGRFVATKMVRSMARRGLHMSGQGHPARVSAAQSPR